MKPATRIEHVPSVKVEIFIAGDAEKARQICQKFCDDRGLCVTVTETTYVYTGGREAGVIVGLINYPRFPSDAAAIGDKAAHLALRLREGLGQESFTIQGLDWAHWYSWRDQDSGEDQNPESKETRP